MSDSLEEGAGTGPSQRSVEIGVAAFFALLAIIGIYGSLKVGISWAADGPRAGFFPFYVSLIVLVCCVVNAAQAAMAGPGGVFADRSQFGKVLSVLVPTAIYAALVPYIGMYVSSALLIGLFMRWFGRYPWLTVATVALAVPIATFVTFEIWFLVPLPKGPLEHFLGY